MLCYFPSFLLNSHQAIGSTILGDLRRQRESLERSQSQVQDIDGSISKANRVVKKMGQWWRIF